MGEKFSTEWTGDYPCLCCGRWIFYYNDKEMKIPHTEEFEDIMRENMNTRGVYRRWYFDDRYLEQFESYEDGLGFKEWYLKNKEWIEKLFKENNIPNTVENNIGFYKALQKSEWRHGSCVGCI